MTGRLLFLAVICVSVASCVSGSNMQPVATVPYTIGPAEQTAIQEGVRMALKDPLSALFNREFKAFQESSGTTWVCGWVNAKNSFGGYTGDKPFIGSLVTNKFVLVGMGGTDIETQVVLQTCGKYGIYI